MDTMLHKPKVKLVDWPDHVVGKAGDILDSDTLGACVGIAIIDRKNLKAVVGHYDNPRAETHLIDEMLLAARSAIPEIVDALVVVAGTSKKENKKEEKEIYGEGGKSELRKFVINKLKSFDLSDEKEKQGVKHFRDEQIRQRWNDKEGTQRILVDLRGDKATYRVSRTPPGWARASVSKKLLEIDPVIDMRRFDEGVEAILRAAGFQVDKRRSR